MYSFTLLTLLLTASYVAALPLDYTWKHDPAENPTWKQDKWEKVKLEQEQRPIEPEKTLEKEASKTPDRVKKVDDAVKLAHKKVESMQTFLAKHPDEGKLKETPEWKSSFGPNANVATVKETIEKMATKTVKINSADPNHADRVAKKSYQGVNGFTRYKHGVGMGSIHLGSHFYRGNSEGDDHNRAGTIIHEASHQLSRTGDHAKPATNKIIKAGLTADPLVDKNSYRDSVHFPGLLTSSPNMHDNADSYRKFAEACHGMVRRRALLTDDPVGYYLAKRSSCALPKDYFAKKAAANKAGAAKGTTTKGATAAKSGLTKGKLAGTKAAGTTARGKAGVGKVHKVGKGTSTKAAKGVHKVGKGTTSRKAAGAKGLKAAKGAKGPKAAKGAKGLKGATGSRASRKTAGAKGLKAAAKGTKGVKASKPAAGRKATKGRVATKGTKTAKGAKGPKAAKGTKPHAAKGTKGPKVAGTKKGKATARKGAKSTTSKAKQGPLSPKRGQGVTKSASKVAKIGKAATKASPKAAKVAKAAKLVTKAAPRAAKVAKAAPKVAGKKKNQRRALTMESILDELE